MGTHTARSCICPRLAAAPSRASAPARMNSSWLGRLLCWAPLRAAGKYSYALYVFPFPLHTLLGVRLVGATESLASPAAAIAYVIALTAATFVIGWASYHLYEKHFLR